MSAPELDDATIAAWWHRNSAAQGLPDEITDPATIAKIVTLAFAGTEHRDGGPAESRRHRETSTEATPPSRRHAQRSATRQRRREKPPRTAEGGARP
jgi:hypothetical protein